MPTDTTAPTDIIYQLFNLRRFAAECMADLKTLPRTASAYHARAKSLRDTLASIDKLQAQLERLAASSSATS